VEPKLCTFHLDNYWFGVAVEKVQEVVSAPPVTPVPLAPCGVAGLVNLRGQIVTVMDLRRRLGLPERRPAAPLTIVVVQVGKTTIGLLVDEAGEVVEAPEEMFEVSPARLPPECQKLVPKVCKLPRHLLHVLDLDCVVRGDGAEAWGGSSLKDFDSGVD